MERRCSPIVDDVSLLNALPHSEPAPCAGYTTALIGQGQQLVAQRVVQQAAEIAGRPPERHAQIRPADVADKQRVAGQHGLRLGLAAIEVVDDEGNRLGRVPRRLERLQPHSPQVDDVAVVERRERILGPRGGAQIDRRAGAIAQLEVAGDEVGVEVGEEDVRDPQAVLGGEGEVLIDVALRVDDGRRVRLLVADEIRRVCEAIQIELLQDHRTALPWVTVETTLLPVGAEFDGQCL